MRTKRYIRTIFAMLMLLLYGAGEVWAQVTADDILIQVMPSGIEGKGSVTDEDAEGSVVASVGELTGEEGSKYYPVTLTVTPTKSGYKINKDLIVVEKMVNPGRSSAPRRAPGIGTFVLSGSDDWVTSPGSASYTFSEMM